MEYICAGVNLFILLIGTNKKIDGSSTPYRLNQPFFPSTKRIAIGKQIMCLAHQPQCKEEISDIVKSELFVAAIGGPYERKGTGSLQVCCEGMHSQLLRSLLFNNS